MSDLKPCPFCGSCDVGEDGEINMHGAVEEYIQCFECGSRAPDAAWNNRPAPLIGTRFRNEAGEVVAVVVPSEATPDMCDELSIAKHHLAVNKWRKAIDALPEPRGAE